ncbi:MULTISPECIES: DsrE family protein [unclassified Halomonas]|uniref:DsrE family protein n=1 Tax=unclassified Halomonas TaxID=2609666 RepID=UPI00209D99FE|nr:MULTISPECIES: DsrE family protein [unclassified Halomonas]MCP1314053.1 DsrE family protein [Halomonas sp. 707D7]MCP1325930.1 DsrE family protein [Halomonas sp. 707D4]
MVDDVSRLITLSRAPYDSNTLREGLDVALVAAAFGEPVTLLFQGQGVLALVKDQAAGAPGQKAVHPILAMLEMYDIDELLVAEESLLRLGLAAEQLIPAAQVISNAELAALYRGGRDILHF